MKNYSSNILFFLFGYFVYNFLYLEVDYDTLHNYISFILNRFDSR